MRWAAEMPTWSRMPRADELRSRVGSLGSASTSRTQRYSRPGEGLCSEAASVQVPTVRGRVGAEPRLAGRGPSCDDCTVSSRDRAGESETGSQSNEDLSILWWSRLAVAGTGRCADPRTNFTKTRRVGGRFVSNSAEARG